MSIAQAVPKLSLEELRREIKKEYANVAQDPTKDYHFHTGRRLAKILGYDEGLYADVPDPSDAMEFGTQGIALPGAKAEVRGGAADVAWLFRFATIPHAAQVLHGFQDFALS